MNTADLKKPLAQDLRYYLPRWLVFGVVAGLLSAAATPTVATEHVNWFGGLVFGAAYGLLSGLAFVGLQRFSNLDGSRFKWWLNALVSTIAARLALWGVISLIGH